MLLLLVVFLVYLHQIGIPRWVLNRWLSAQETQHRYLEIGRMSFNPFEGLVAHRFAYFETKERVLPLLEAQRVDVEFDMSKWIRGQPCWYGMTAEEATVRMAPGSSLVRAPPENILTLEHLAGQFSWNADAITVEQVSGEMLDIQFRGRGVIQLTGGAGPAILELPTGSPAAAEEATTPAWLPELIAQLNQLAFDRAPDLDVSFDLVPRDLMASHIRVTGIGGATRIRGVKFDRWLVVGEYAEEEVVISDATLHQGGDQLHAELTYAPETRELSGSATCSLPPGHWQSLLPMAWRDSLTQRGFRLSGPMAWTVDFGPAPVDEILKRMSGSLDVHQAEVRGLWLEHFQSTFDSGPSSFALADMDLAVGANAEYGTLQGSFEWFHADGRYEGTMQSQLDFAGLAPLLNEKQVALARSYQLEDRPLAADVRFEGKKGDREAFRIYGDVSGTNVFYRGAHLARGSTRLTVSNRVVQLDDLHVERDEGTVDGFLRLDFENGIVGLDFEGTADAKAIGRLSGTTTERILRNFEFGAPIQGTVRGAVNYHDREGTHLEIQMGGDDVSLRAYRSDHLDVDILWTNDVFDVRGIRADIYGGTVTGAYQVILQEPGTPPLYHLSARAKGLVFADLVRAMAHEEGEHFRGRISGTADLHGVLAAGQANNLAGTGSVELVDGRILSIPVFGGLSRGLSHIYPGLGFAKQTDFLADFRLQDLSLTSRNVRLEGDLFSLEGAGSYGLVDRSLDFKVEFKLLREGNVGTVVRVVTLPLTKLLMFDLEGTLSEPRWRPNNLPRELFEVFE